MHKTGHMEHYPAETVPNGSVTHSLRKGSKKGLERPVKECETKKEKKRRARMPKVLDIHLLERLGM